ncbi:MAG: transposase [Albidovulum sp.]|nr:transposase [Albidovulum sp.]
MLDGRYGTRYSVSEVNQGIIGRWTPPPNWLSLKSTTESFRPTTRTSGGSSTSSAGALPLHRQHQRLEAAGIRAGRYSPANWMPGSASLLAPIRDAQFRSILESRVIAMDETPIRAAERARRLGPESAMRKLLRPD